MHRPVYTVYVDIQYILLEMVQREEESTKNNSSTFTVDHIHNFNTEIPVRNMEKALAEKFSGQGKALPETLQIDHVSAATRLLEKRRQMFEVQEALNSQKEEFTRREDAFRRREEALRRKDLELQESLIKFNKFLQENEVSINFCYSKVTLHSR